MRYLIVFFLLFLSDFLSAQSNPDADSLFAQRQEAYISVSFQSVKELPELLKLLYVDEIRDHEVIAYVNRKQFEDLAQTGRTYKLLVPPSMQGEVPRMKNYKQIRESNDWDYYPTYDAYLAMMENFEDEYPDLCSIHTIGILPSGRKLLAARINPDPEAGGKPEFLYTAPIHGDELVGYILNLRLIDYLLSNYGTNPRVTNLVNNIDIWINPLANPDGTYKGGNNTVWGSTRTNANGVDLNRNYPDPEDGTNPDGNPHQPETLAFMEFAEDRNFVMSANHHSGAEVINYPWDTWSRLHADDDWWVLVSREYADTAQYFSPPGYLTDLNNGITNGYQWYSISGGRQDYMNYFHNCREVTSELSTVKKLPTNQLPAHWEYNYRSLLNYLEQSLFGIRGVITDSVTGNPIVAKVEIPNHDIDFSFVYSSLPAGNYHRPLKEGVYNLNVSAPGYKPKTIQSVQVTDRQTTVVDIEMVPASIAANFSASITNPAKGQRIEFTDLSYGNNITGWEWTFEGAEPATSYEQNPAGVLYPTTGIFDVSLKVTNSLGETSELKRENYISVNTVYIMQNAVFETCEGNFFDSGGDLGFYQNNEDYVVTFVPDSENMVARLYFQAFSLEEHNDCLYDYLSIYDGTSVESPLLGTWCGNSSPGLIVATNESGALTVKFHSDDSERMQGWFAAISCTTSVGLPDFNVGDNLLSISPNPVINESLRINAVVGIKQVRLLNTNMKILQQWDAAGANNIEVELGAHAAGFYLLQISTDHGAITRKLIKK